MGREQCIKDLRGLPLRFSNSSCQSGGLSCGISLEQTGSSGFGKVLTKSSVPGAPHTRPRSQNQSSVHTSPCSEVYPFSRPMLSPDPAGRCWVGTQGVPKPGGTAVRACYSRGRHREQLKGAPEDSLRRGLMIRTLET